MFTVTDVLYSEIICLLRMVEDLTVRFEAGEGRSELSKPRPPK